MLWSILKKDLKKNKAINAVLLLFIAISACLISTGTVIIIQLFNSIDSMYKIAQPPHFMQMHVGDINEDEIGKFADNYDYVTDWQIIDMLNIDGSKIWVTNSDNTTYSLSDCMLGLGMVKENEKYDLLLDSDNKPVYPQKGEIGVPIILLENYNINIGDTITISEGDFIKEFTVKYFLRDPQMNSTLCSSTRFLLNEDDISELQQTSIGSLEYLIEFYFTDTSYATDFQTEYENSGMPINGQALTYTIIRLISGLSDMITVVLIVLVSILLIFVAGLCLRFTILATVEEDIKEIGNMKAIGLSFKDIRAIYLQKYRILSVCGCVIGYLISILVNQVFTAHITETFGKSDTSWLAFVIPIIFVALVYVVDVLLCKKILKYIKKVSVVDTISGNYTPFNKGKYKISKFVKISKVKSSSTNLWLALKDIVIHKKTWFTMFFVMVISTIIMIIPFNLLNTFKSPEFITYMGQSNCDIMISVSTTEGLQNHFDKINDILKQDDNVSNYSCEAYVTYAAVNKDGEWANVHVACSEDAQTGLKFIEGNAPQNADEIALSLLNANELGVEKASDTISMLINGVERKVRVSGIYQDVTNGGYTSKMYKDYKNDNVYKYVFTVNLKNGASVESTVDRYIGEMGTDVDIKELGEFVNQTLGGVTSQLENVVVVIAVTAVLLAILITVLFLKLVIVKERSQNAILKTMGFSTREIRIQYIYKTCFISILGIIVGIIFVNTLGESFVSAIIGMVGLGISKISFIVNPIEVYILWPALLLVLIIASTFLCSSVLKKYNLVELIKE